VELSTLCKRVLASFLLDLDTHFFVPVQEAIYSSHDTENTARDSRRTSSDDKLLKVRVWPHAPGNVCDTSIHYRGTLYLNPSFFPCPSERSERRMDRGCDRCPLCTGPLAPEEYTRKALVCLGSIRGRAFTAGIDLSSGGFR